MKATVLIDGYNLMFALGFLPKKDEPRALETARRRLLEFLEARSGSLPGETTVVFDARRKPLRGLHEEMRGAIRVVYAVQREADDVLEEMIAQQPRPCQLLIVSDDQRVQRAARRGRVQALGCQDLLDLLERPARPPVTPASEKPSLPADAETRSWLEEFGDVQLPREWRDPFAD